ncbi:MAG: hypothetical protein AB1611_09695 [bacterium]
MKKVKPYDRSLKILAKYHPHIFLSLLIDPAEVEGLEITVENPELNLPEMRCDYAWHVSRGDEEGYFIFEFQLKPDREALKSAFIKCALLHGDTGLPVVGVILYLTRSTCQHSYEVSLHGRSNQYRFETIHLWEYREEIESGKRKELAPFLILMADHPDEKVLRREKELIGQVEDEKERANLLSIAMTLALRHFKEKWVKELFKEEIAMIKEANIFQEWIDEATEKGIQQGIQQGARETAQESIVKVLETRFDLVPVELIKSIKKIDEISALHELLKKAVVVKSLAEFRKILRMLG